MSPVHKGQKINRKPTKTPGVDLREQSIGFRLPPDLIREFRAEAKAADVTMTSVVEDGIREWLRRRKFIQEGKHPVVRMYQ